MKKLILLFLLFVVGLLLLLLLANTTEAQKRYCVEWKTWTEIYVCGTEIIYGRNGQKIGTKPIYCERERKECVKWDYFNPRQGPSGGIRGELNVEEWILLQKLL